MTNTLTQMLDKTESWANNDFEASNRRKEDFSEPSTACFAFTVSARRELAPKGCVEGSSSTDRFALSDAGRFGCSKFLRANALCPNCWVGWGSALPLVGLRMSLALLEMLSRVSGSDLTVGRTCGRLDFLGPVERTESMRVISFRFVPKSAGDELEISFSTRILIVSWSSACFFAHCLI